MLKNTKLDELYKYIKNKKDITTLAKSKTDSFLYDVLNEFVSKIDVMGRYDFLLYNMGKKSISKKALKKLALNKKLVKIAKLLIDKGADVNQRSSLFSHDTPFSYLLRYVELYPEFHELISYAIKHNANLDTQYKSIKLSAYTNIITYLIQYDKKDLFELLLKNKKIDITKKDSKGANFLYHALWLQKFYFIKRFDELGLKFNARNHFKKDIWYYAVFSEDPKIVKFLINNYNFNQKEKLYYAQFDLLQLYIDQGYSIKKAIMKGNSKIAKLLTKFKDLADTKNNQLYNQEILENILSLGFNLNSSPHNKSKFTYLEQAIINPYPQSVKIVEILLKYGAKPNLKIRDYPALSYTGFSKYNLEKIKLLLKYGANIDAQDKDGDTILHQCVIDMKKATKEKDSLLKIIKLKEILKLYLQHNPNKTIKNKKGQTAYDLAVKYLNDYEIIELLNYEVKKKMKSKKKIKLETNDLDGAMG